MNRADYQPQEILSAPLREVAQIWRLVLALVLIGVVSTLLSTVFLLSAVRLVPGAWAWQLADGLNPVAMFLLLMSFSFMTLATGMAARLLQRRSLVSVLGDWPLFVFQFRRVLLGMFLLMGVVFLLPPYDMGEPLRPNLAFGDWLLLLPLSLLGVLIQTGAEEIVFRGYFQQALAARFKSPLIWLLLPSVLFGLGHYMPAEAGENAWLICLWATVFGLLMADLTARSGTLGPAIAVHFANNIVALLLIASPDSLNGLALYLSPYALSDTEHLRSWLLVDGVFLLVTWLVARLAIRR
ncbi:CAAX amino terminal protease family protein [Roseobacter sp. SK209-2-6]|uniref:CPBP family intramembrane glutamic endopeptidase n=1 Tax=Roseobacter sp. SK209-2-6 TaxID=388739 RepID=UPI0000F3D876|nr:type II CAAX endopeptidase family protein [Roseobacter sp. SK209-2-6]EBA17540.1 CAAX amino terminal protease family protein [Roseobacter sp. SK209-2-6]